MSKLTPEQLEALFNYAKLNGRNWKRALNWAWISGNYGIAADPASLQQIRNQFGPEWLLKFKLTK